MQRLSFLFFFALWLASCAAPGGGAPATPALSQAAGPTATLTPAPTLTFTLQPTATPTETPETTATATPEPVLYCSDRIPGCYFLGSEIARIFARMTVTCFENGGECYPPVENCTVLPSKVVHVPVENFATAWESEVNGNPAYKDLLNSKLYDPAKQYCFVDEGIAQLVRNAGNAEYTANKACLDNEKVPCDVALLFFKSGYVVCGGDCQGLDTGAYPTGNNFWVFAVWTDKPLPEMDLESVMNGKPTAGPWFIFAHVFVSSTVGFNYYNENPPLDIRIGYIYPE
jgi:hypothetical protein